jgi:lipopolysaccharide/colanic/teichoic acid biosynthesis glycosyltransferase
MSQRNVLTLKRAIDIVVSLFALIVLSPLIGIIAVAIKFDDNGPVLFVQDRVGKEGRVFRCCKFRTMVVGAGRKGLGLEVAEGDSRITRPGHFLRHWTLDEIPQLLNVLKGDISIIGPRPTVPSQVSRYTPQQRRRLEVKPGMAGWAWIHGRNSIPWQKRIELDIWYVDHWSLWLDLKIFLKAFLMLFRREGLYGADGVVRDLE